MARSEVGLLMEDGDVDTDLHDGSTRHTSFYTGDLCTLIGSEEYADPRAAVVEGGTLPCPIVGDAYGGIGTPRLVK